MIILNKTSVMILLFAALFPMTAHAQNMRINGANFRLGTAAALRCYFDQKLYNSGTVDAPTMIAKSFAGDGKVLTFRTCRDAEDHTHYFVREPRPNRNGVCRIFENEIFPGVADDEHIAQILYDGTAPNWMVALHGWKSWPPTDWTVIHYDRIRAELGYVTDGQCPPGDDPRYINLTNVTDGLLRQFFASWKAAASSRDIFIRTFGPGLRSERMWQIGLSGKPQFKAIICGPETCSAEDEEGPFVLFDVGPHGIQFAGPPDVVSIP